MADPTTNLPQITNFVPRGPVPYGNPGTLVPQVAPVPVVNNFVSRAPNPAQQGYTTGNPPVIPRVVPATPTPVAATPVAAVAPAPAVPVAPPAAAPSAAVPLPVSATPGEGNPLPPGMRGGAATAGTVPTPGAVQGLPTLPVGNIGGGGGGASAGASDAGGGDGIEVIRAGVPTVEGGSGTVARGGGIQDPQGVINAGFDTQTARAEQFINQAMSYVNAGGNIFERATRGRFVNGLLSATVGPNNVGQVQGQGQDTLNSAIAGIAQAGIGANAQEYGAGLNYLGNEERIQGARALQTQQIESQPVVIGQRFVDNGMGIRVAQPIYGLGTADQTGRVGAFRPIAGNGMVVTPQPAQAPAAPAVGTTRTRASGAVERFDGKNWTAEK